MSPNVVARYQPLEDLYLLLITNKSSNIVEDLETLRLMARVVPEFCPDLTDAGVTAQVRYGQLYPCSFACSAHFVYGFGAH
jgi:hypothetical protein